MKTIIITILLLFILDSCNIQNNLVCPMWGTTNTIKKSKTYKFKTTKK